MHALRKTVGDDAFFRILRTWAEEKRDGNATTEEFVAHAERVSGNRWARCSTPGCSAPKSRPGPDGSRAGDDRRAAGWTQRG